MTPWAEALQAQDPNIDIEIWPDVADKQNVQFAVSWNQPKHVLDSYPNMKAISSLGAGVDHLLDDEALPESVTICRVVAPSLVQQMKEYVLGAVINIQRNFTQYIRQKDTGRWEARNHPLAQDVNIGILGLGELGRPVAQQLAHVGYNVSGWAQSAKNIDAITTYAGTDQLSNFLNNTQIVICLLPLTSKTRDILALDLFKELRSPSWVINVARGEHLVDEDLIYALDSGIIEGAWLDVFDEEPLPDKHAFWNREKVIVTPHIASITKPSEVAGQIVENYKRALSGMDLNYSVDRSKGY
ncbi:MAG: glyoxylate/hydroxypyruvate reductase A [Fodinibius sp.]|nr:glyoxylate/hydroxypyruvate reductase A [Fodinibius sp.]